jgi:type I restriction enzyme M protein
MAKQQETTQPVCVQPVCDTNVEAGRRTDGQLERTLWDAANKLCGNINSSDYKYVVLGLIFIKYVSDAFETQFAKYKAEGFDETDEDFLRDYLAKDNIFYVPPTARWRYLQYHAKQPQIGELVDKAMDAIEKENK